MNHFQKSGLYLCSKYALPPNSLHLCGPDKQKDLTYYSTSGSVDKGTTQILSQFTTLYPYLRLIATENKIPDPFDIRVIEAYWLGSSLLNNVSIRATATHFTDTLCLRRKLETKALNKILKKLPIGTLPYHAFHVLNIYKRTGQLDISHTLESMNACIINWGRVKQTLPTSLIVETQSLSLSGNKLKLDMSIDKEILLPEGQNNETIKINTGDIISYHWGIFCDKLTRKQLRNLIYYTNRSLKLANLI